MVKTVVYVRSGFNGMNRSEGNERRKALQFSVPHGGTSRFR